MYQETVVKESRFTAWLIFEVSTFLHKHVPETVVKESHPKARINLEVPTYLETVVKESRHTDRFNFDVSTFLHKHVHKTVLQESQLMLRLNFTIPTNRGTAVKESRIRPDSHEVSRQALTRYQKLSSKKLHRKHPAAVGPVYVTKPGTSA